MFVILLAGLTAIPPNLYEAAELDGVGAVAGVFVAITLPHLTPMILLALTFRLLDAIRMFDTIFIMTGGGPGTKTYTASYYLYTVGFTQFHLSQATAGSWLFLIVTAARHRPAGPAAPSRGGRVMAASRIRRRLRAGNVWRVLLLGFVHRCSCCSPLYWMFNTSIKPSDDYLTRRRRSGSLQSRRWSTTPPPCSPTAGLQGLINSLDHLAVGDGHLGAWSARLMAYSLARFNGPAASHLSFWVLSQRFLPPIAIILPIFLIYRNIGLYDTRRRADPRLHVVFTLPVSVWMMFAYFRQMPKSMEEAALVDGCTQLAAPSGAVAVPLAAPGIVAASVFAFIACWTEFFFALILTSRTAFTLPTVFRAFTGFQGAQYGEAAALAIVSLGPSIALGVLAQRHLVRGLTLGAVRG